MDKRYQVFVSSTYTDLREERQLVTQTLMKMDCIPAGMELFPASDEEQFEFIKRVIDDCDYYLLIIGGRYGSVTAEGVSYTEKEYDYAVEKGLRVVALLHGKPGSIAVDKSESTEEAKQKLAAFREKVSGNRLVDFWTEANALPGLVALSMLNAIKTFPRVGWIRADKAASEDLLVEINELRKENISLKRKLAELDLSPPIPEDIATLDDTFRLKGEGFVDGGWNSSKGRRETVRQNWSRALTWRQIFEFVAPYLREHPNDQKAKGLFEQALTDNRVSRFTLDAQNSHTITLQLEPDNIIDISYAKTVGGGMGLFLSLTPSGKALMQDTRLIKSSKE